MSEQVQEAAAEVCKEVSGHSEPGAEEKTPSEQPKIDKVVDSAKSGKEGENENAAGDAQANEDSCDSVEIIADSAAAVKEADAEKSAEVKEGDKDGDGEDEFGQEQKEEEQANGHKRKSVELSAAAEDSSEKPEAKRQKMQDENEENKKENENVST